MTSTRNILLTLITFAPLTAWGQVFTSSPPGLIDGPRGNFQSRSNLGVIADPGYSDAAGFDRQADSEILLMQGSELGTAPQGQPEVLSQQQIPPGITTGAGRRYNTSPMWQTSGKGGYFGIMGAITRPGVYFSNEQHITLGDLLKLSGGATPAASGGVRIVRQGRGGLQTFLTPDSKHEIMNGDVVLLETQRSALKTGLRDYRNNTSTGDAAASPDAAANAKTPALAYLAFVNLLPQPIVVPVPSDQATLAAVVKWLHQDAESPPFVRVIAPNPVLRQNSSRPVEQQVLENGTVLVFDPATIKPERLPPFPPVIGLAPPSEGTPVSVPSRAAIAQPPQVSDPVQIPPPASRQQRPTPTLKPLRAPPPPTTQRDPRSAQVQQFGQAMQGVAPTEIMNDVPSQGGPQIGGPLLMMPQMNRPPRSQATIPDAKSRPSVPPKRLQSQRDEEATPANYVGQTMSWQSRPPVRANGGLDEVDDDQGVVQAHGEEGRIDDDFSGPALELPNPVPKLVDPEPIVPSEPALEPAAAAQPKFVPSTFSMQIVWFSVGSMLLLMVILWFVARWDGPRPVRAALTAGHTSRFRAPAPASHGTGTPQPALRILTPTSKAVAEAPLPMPPVAPTVVPEPVRAKPAAPAPTPGPTRTISQEEQRLRAHFRETRQARSAATPEPIQPPAAPAPVVATSSSTVTREELRHLIGRAGGSAEKILAQVPTVKTPNPPANQVPAAAGNLLDRVLRTQQKR